MRRGVDLFLQGLFRNSPMEWCAGENR
jgi:hypothetical protein